ncbi:MAG TPA: hypothetical protein VIV60_29915, partial [Polyangiaceae bacterium]
MKKLTLLSLLVGVIACENDSPSSVGSIENRGGTTSLVLIGGASAEGGSVLAAGGTTAASISGSLAARGGTRNC